MQEEYANICVPYVIHYSIQENAPVFVVLNAVLKIILCIMYY